MPPLQCDSDQIDVAYNNNLIRLLYVYQWQNPYLKGLVRFLTMVTAI